ncbi:hypothetical protein N0V86_000567 [Didymella sp. IMI 355093]|nr:hypothetical protein N0V86_000567 [Didymella sp. IMI 355093]
MSPRQYMSLTQVSRQIRDEFRPIYHEQTNVKVSTYDLAGYLRDALEVDHIEGKSVAGNISVELCVFGAPFAISFMRLLNLFASSVHLRLSFVTNGLYGGTSLAEPLNEMLRTEKDALVLEQSRSPVSEIALVKHDWGWQFFTIYAFVKESAWEEWMDEWDDAVAYTCLPMRRDMVEQGKAWARSIGLSLSNDDSISSVLRFKKACTDSERAEGSQVGSLKLGDLFLKQIEAVYEY